MIDILPPTFEGTESEQLDQMIAYLDELYDVLERKYKNIDMSDLNYDLAERIKKKNKEIYIYRSGTGGGTTEIYLYKFFTTYKNFLDRDGYITDWFLQLKGDNFLMSIGKQRTPPYSSFNAKDDGDWSYATGSSNIDGVQQVTKDITYRFGNTPYMAYCYFGRLGS